jgi:hypothetical protein
MTVSEGARGCKRGCKRGIVVLTEGVVEGRCHIVCLSRVQKQVRELDQHGCADCGTVGLRASPRAGVSSAVDIELRFTYTSPLIVTGGV